MAGCVGTERQARLQQRSDESARWSSNTPGAYISGRMLGSDDVDALGWETILKILEIDGVFGFRMLPSDRVASVEERIVGMGYRIDWWDNFFGSPSSAIEKCEAIVAGGLPDGLQLVEFPEGTDAAAILRVQELLVASGIVPYSAAMLLGRVCPAVTIAIADGGGSPVAVGHAYLPHNRYSPYRRHAWVGLIAVGEAERGKGLGKLINACLIEKAFLTLGAGHVYESVSAANVASRRMIEACGLVFDPSLKTGVISSGSERFSR